jgi:alpha-ketoglutarate-dependent taurine dioxygenase/acyl carrier protein
VLAAGMSEEHLSAPPSLRVLIFGGEKAVAQRLSQWNEQVSDQVQLWNFYGPTEATIAATVCELPAETEVVGAMREVPIGKPKANTQTYVLDASLRPVPVGVAGELHIGGAGVARGYLKQPDITAERFIPHPFSSISGARLYRTGDLARYRPDGQLEYLGRVDGQVKVRGYRIELGEIEAALSGHPLVHDVAVIAEESEPGESRIVAYLVSSSGETLTAGALRNHLKTTLPEYMIPAAFVLLESLPLTATDKIDRHALSADKGVLLELSETSVQYSSPVEEMLAGVWAEVLKLERVGVRDNFFELGGHSLLATQLISRVREIFHLDVPLRLLFELPTVAELAQSIEEAQRNNDGLQAPPIQAIPDRTNLPLSFAQQRLWFLHQLEPGSHAYTLPSAVRLTGRLDVDALEQSLDEIMRRHEILRTTFGLKDGQAVQVIAPAQKLPLPRLDLTQWPEKEREAQVRKLIAEAATHVFDLSRGPLIDAKLLRLSEEEHVLLLTMHHIVSDAWSTGIFVDEAAKLYASISSGARAAVTTLEPLPIQYADYAVWQREWLTAGVLDQQLSYWKERLQGASPVLALPTDKPRPLLQNFAGARETFNLSAGLSEKLRELSRREGVTLFMTLLAAFSVLLSRLSGQSEVNIGAPVAGRTRGETERLIGYFINASVLRIVLSGDPTFRQLLKQVRETALGAYAHQEVPFEKLVEVLHPERQTNYAPLFQVVFNFQNAPTSMPSFQDLTFSVMEIETNTTKYDLTLYMWDSPDELTGALAYQTALFETPTIRRLIRHFEALLSNIVVDPEARVSALEVLSEGEKQQQILINQKRAETNRKRLANIKREAVKLSSESLIETGYLQPGATLPLVIRPAADDVDLIDWSKHHRQFIEKELLKHGAILFRGFNVTDVPMFERFARTVTSSLVNYVEGSSPRISMGDQLYTSTEYPPELFISLHNELSYAHKWPGKIFFCCLQVPSQGGETPIADSRKVYSLLDSKTKEAFAQKEVKYLRNLKGKQGAGLSWQSVFETTDRVFVEEYCRQGGIEYAWKDDGSLHTAQVRPAVAQHPVTGETVWFNQVDQWHPSNLGSEAARAMLAVIREEDLPINARYGDDSALEEATLDEIREVFRQVTVSFPWQQGDVMLLDNMLVAHGRYPFSGPRQIVVAMGDTVTLMDTSHNGN